MMFLLIAIVLITLALGLIGLGIRQVRSQGSFWRRIFAVGLEVGIHVGRGFWLKWEIGAHV